MFMNRTIKPIIYLLIALLLAIELIAQDTVQIVTTWLNQNSVPVKYLESGNSYSAFQPLKEALKDVSVVGIEESTHGTHEFFKVAHRLIEFLVKQMKPVTNE
jgi:erythromycin esterase-like protein